MNTRERIVKLAQTLAETEANVLAVGNVCPRPDYKTRVDKGEAGLNVITVTGFRAEPCQGKLVPYLNECPHFKGLSTQYNASSDISQAMQVKGVKCIYK